MYLYIQTYIIMYICTMQASISLSLSLAGDLCVRGLDHLTVAVSCALNLNPNPNPGR